MPEELLTRAAWEKICNIERLNAQLKSIDAEIQEIEERSMQEIQALDERKAKLQEEIKKLVG